MDETLFLTVTMIGIFWEKQVMPSKKLQLVVVTAMLFACKYLEVSVPLVEDSVLSYDDAYTEGQILEMVISIQNCMHIMLNGSSYILTTSVHHDTRLLFQIIVDVKPTTDVKM